MKGRRRRTVPAVLAALLLLLAGCRGIGRPAVDYDALVRETLAREYTMTADIAYGGTGAVVTLTKTGEADLEAVFSAPEVLAGLTVTAVGERVAVRYRGMDVDLSAYAVPTQSLTTLLREVLTGEKEGRLTVEAAGDTVTASGSILLTTYQLIFDKETMALRQVLIPSVEGTADITDFRFLDEDEAA